MKSFLLILSVALLFSCQPKKDNNTHELKNETPEIAQFEFREEMHNFGEIEAGEIVIYTFVFTNTGEHDLKIGHIESDCGCVTATAPDNVIKPGDKGLIEVEFNSAGLWGRQLKSITIQANTEKPKQLVIFADVDNEQLNIKN